MHLTPTIERFRYLKLAIIFVLDLLLRMNRRLFSILTYNNEVVAIIAFHKLGDTVFTIPAIRVLFRKMKDRKIIIFCFPESRSIYNKAFPEIETEIIYHNEFRFEGRIAKHSGKMKIRKYKPQIIFDLTGTIQSASMIFNIRAREIIGINKEYFKHIYDVFTPIRNIPHMIDIYLDAIKDKIQIGDRENIKTFPARLSSNNGGLLFHPLAGWASKEWGIDKYVDLILELKDYDRTLIISGYNYDKSQINLLLNDGVKLIETNDIDSLMEIIESHSVFIGNDSGPANISSLLGVPTFIVYGSTNPVFHLPYGKYHEYIQKKIWCTPNENDKLCYTDGGKRGCPSFECMKQLTVEEVKIKLVKFLITLDITKHDKVSG
jgi:ADP-heptose:LPS heptosyltransferase